MANLDARFDDSLELFVEINGTGDPGASAYDVWVSLGNEGTEQDYLNSLKGDKGDTGLTGPQGIQGEKGLKGDTGLTGPQGIQGEKGLKGDTGLQGPQGIQGDVGPKGDTGLQGPQGVQGDVGPKGDTGLQGPQGIQGEVGPKGDTGLQGPQGIHGDVGPKGDTGDSGVFIGPDTPTNSEVKVWIDTDEPVTNASDIPIIDVGNYFASDNIEGALLELVTKPSTDVELRLNGADITNNANLAIKNGTYDTGVGWTNLPIASNGVLIVFSNANYRIQLWKPTLTLTLYVRVGNTNEFEGNVYNSWDSWIKFGTDYGATSERPKTGLVNGQMFYDMTLSKPIFAKYGSWRDANGTSV